MRSGGYGHVYRSGMIHVIPLGKTRFPLANEKVILVRFVRPTEKIEGTGERAGGREHGGIDRLMIEIRI